jgi:hypothetical protein
MKTVNLSIKSVLLVAILAIGMAAAATAHESYPIRVSLGLTGVQGAAAQRQIKPVELAGNMITPRAAYTASAQADRSSLSGAIVGGGAKIDLRQLRTDLGSMQCAPLAVLTICVTRKSAARLQSV